RHWQVTALLMAGLFGRSSLKRVTATSGIDRRILAAHSDFSKPLSYLAAGGATAQRVIFIHGTPGSATSWLDFLSDVPGGFEFIAVDRPGFGQSCPDQATVSLDAQAAALRPLLVRRNGRWPLVVGHSFGATIAAKLAAKYPSQVGGLILVAGAMNPELEKIHLLQHIA
ncbi:MAG: alpha/beta fold hydrolase, partial [Bacteroidales bacterium]|nr:alpha/beta fold hydrolase [Bacteroidales bacterium]